MFEFVRRHNRLLQLALVLLIFPSFVVFGIQGYQRFAGEGHAVAEVAGRDISQQELDNAHRQQVERMQQQMPGIDIKLLDTPAMKQRVLEDLVRERVLLEAARKMHLAPSDEQLMRVFQSDPQFAGLRNTDGTVRRELLEARGVSSEQFAQQIKQDLALRQVMGGLGASTVAVSQPALTALNALYQQRDVRVARFDPKDYKSKVDVSDAEVQAYYDDAQNAARLQAPESVDVEYVVLDLAAVKKSITVPEQDLQEHYKANLARYTQPEERRVRHILIAVDKQASAQDRTRAQGQAEEILATLKKSRGTFAEIAKKQSQDPGSAAQGGDLDWFGRGAMTKPFEDAAFALKKGELSAVVPSDFGFHILELLDTRGGTARSFESVRTELEQEVRQQLAQKRYVELAEQFTDAVDQEDGLKAVADKFKLELRQAHKLTRAGAGDAKGALANAKLLETIFRSDSLQKKRNTAAVELGGSQLAAARVLSHAPARKLPLTDVKDQVRKLLIDGKAAEAARKDGQGQLTRWQAQPGDAALPLALTLSRAKPQDQPRELIDAVLRAKTDRLPAWLGIDLGAQGFAVVRLDKVSGADVAALGEDRAREQYAQLWAQAEGEAYYVALRDRFKGKILKAPPGEPASAATQ
ncbi:MAG: SurA N-terminal domain-containing protein [Burkholderiales bacterium]